MNPRIWLRIAAILTLIHSVLHTIGGVYGAAAPGPQTVAETAMKANTFMALGSLRSLWMFYRGMGLSVTVFLTVGAIIFWLLGDLTSVLGAGLRPILITFAAGYVAFAVVSWQYFFLAPIVVELLIAACLIIAAIGLRNRAAS